MKIVFMGSPSFAAVSLKRLLDSPHEVAAVVTVPDKPQGRGQSVQPSPVKQLALEHGLELLQPESLNDNDFLKRLKKIKAAAFVVVAFKILPREVFTIPPKGTVNLHASLLPRYRGAAPINWAIIKGARETGVTTILIDEHVDTGKILLQRKTPIRKETDAGSLHDHLAKIGADLLVQSLEGLEVGTIRPVEQNDALATKAPKISKEFCHIDFNQPVVNVFNMVRGLSPVPAAYTYHQNNQIKVFKADISKKKSADQPPGTIVDKDKDRFSVACQDGVLDIYDVQLQGKKRMTVSDFFNGYTINIGEQLQ